MIEERRGDNAFYHQRPEKMPVTMRNMCKYRAAIMRTCLHKRPYGGPHARKVEELIERIWGAANLASHLARDHGAGAETEERFSNVSYLCNALSRSNDNPATIVGYAVTEFCLDKRLAAGEALCQISAGGMGRYLRIPRRTLSPGKIVELREVILNTWKTLLRTVDPEFADEIHALIGRGASHSDSFEWISRVK